jgi:SM-20-related protein
MKIHDGAIAPSLVLAFNQWLQGQALIYGWKARRDAPGQFWHRNYVLPGTYEHHCDQEAVQQELTFERLVAQGTPLSMVASLVSSCLFNSTPLTRVWINVQGFGDESAIHRDFPAQFKGQAKTVVWYPHAEWSPEWGGDVVTFNDSKEIAAAAVCLPNRMVEFDGTQLHAARPISRFAQGQRIAVAFGCEVVNA